MTFPHCWAIMAPVCLMILPRIGRYSDRRGSHFPDSRSVIITNTHTVFSTLPILEILCSGTLCMQLNYMYKPRRPLGFLTNHQFSAEVQDVHYVLDENEQMRHGS